MALQSILDEPALPVPCRSDAVGDDGAPLPPVRHRRRVAAVVLPVGHRPRCRTAARRQHGRPAHARSASRSRSSGCWPTPARERWPTALPLSGCGCRTSTRSSPTTSSSRSTTRRSGRRCGEETELLLRQHRPRGSQRAGAADGRLHVRERAAGEALRHPECHRAAPSSACTVPEYRRGLLGQGSILTLTSVADRTSPVLRGKWVMEVLLGSPPPAPPPNVPSLDDSVKANAGGKMLSTRERMEQHRKNPSCNSCHRVIDPLGLALDNFDVTGAWRIKDNEVPVDVGRRALRRHQDGRPRRPARTRSSSIRTCSS